MKMRNKRKVLNRKYGVIMKAFKNLTKLYESNLQERIAKIEQYMRNNPLVFGE